MRVSTHILSVVVALALAGCGPKDPPADAGSAAGSSAEAAAADGSTATPAATTNPDGTPVVAAPVEAPEERLARVTTEASALLTTGKAPDAAAAVSSLSTLSSEFPDKAEIPYNMGVGHLIQGDRDQARKSFLRATDIDPTLAAAWLNLGALAEQDGQFQRALQNYESGLRYVADNPSLTTGRVRILRKLGQGDKAVEEAKKALNRNANNIDVYNELGLVYLERDELSLAQFVLQKALIGIEGADNNAVLHANLGRVYLEQGKVGAAKKELERALELDADHVPAMMYMASFHLDNRNWADTATLLERAGTLEPENASIQNNLGIAYRGLGRYEEAQAAYKKALDLDPRNPDPYLNLAVLLGDHMKAYDAALATLDDYVAAGGRRTALVDEWRADIEKAQADYKRERDRRKRREVQEKEREERERLAQEHEAREAKAAEEAAKREAEEAEKAAEAAEAEQAAELQRMADEAAAQEAQGSDAPTPAPAEDAASAWGAEAPPPAETAPVEATGGAAAAAGAVCDGVGTCGSPMLECSSEAMCVDAGTKGAYGVGVGCTADAECAFGLYCVSNLCSAASAPAGATPWGGQ